MKSKGAAASQQLKRAKIIDSDNEDEVPGVEGDENQGIQRQADGGESSDEGVRDDGGQGWVWIWIKWLYVVSLTNVLLYLNRDNDNVNDFEAMMAKKKEEGYKRRKNRGIDIINDNDDIIDQLIQDMRAAAEVLSLIWWNNTIFIQF